VEKDSLIYDDLTTALDSASALSDIYYRPSKHSPAYQRLLAQRSSKI